MKTQNFIFFLFLLLILYSSKALSETKVYFIDIDYIINNTNYSNSIINKLNENINKRLEDINNIEKNLVQQEQKLKQAKNVISEDEFNAKLKLLSSNINDFKKKRELEINNINKIKQEEFNKIIEKINPLIEQYVNNENIDILLNKKSILVSKNNLDATKNIINYINEKLK